MIFKIFQRAASVLVFFFRFEVVSRFHFLCIFGNRCSKNFKHFDTYVFRPPSFLIFPCLCLSSVSAFPLTLCWRDFEGYHLYFTVFMLISKASFSQIEFSIIVLSSYQAILLFSEFTWSECARNKEWLRERWITWMALNEITQTIEYKWTKLS